MSQPFEESAPIIFSVGQCGPDNSRLKNWLIRHGLIGPDRGSFVMLRTAADLKAELRHQLPQLVLLNRLFDADGGSGLELIRQLRTNSLTCEIPLMLVSNYADAQAEAVALGAYPGFGKAELEALETLSKVQTALATK